MTTIVINEKSEEGRRLMGIIRSIWKSSDAVVGIYDDEAGVSPLIERVPGLPYTHEERVAAIGRAEMDYAAGRLVSSDELRKKHPRT